MGAPVTDEPIFSLSSVQYAPPAPVVDMRVCSGLLVLLLASNTLILIRLADESNILTVNLPRRPPELRVLRLFLDPSGRHLLVTTAQSETYYVYIQPAPAPSQNQRQSQQAPKPRVLKNFKMIIESVAWGHGSNTSREIVVLVGGNDGTIFEGKLDGSDALIRQQDPCQGVFRLPDKQPVMGLHFEYGMSGHIVVFATTTTRMYTFVGASERRDDGRVFGALFSAYSDTAPKIMDLPGNIPRSVLQLYSPTNSPMAPPKLLAWLTAAGVYHGSLNLSSVESPVDAASLLAYPKQDPPNSPPLGLALTEYHFVYLRKDRLTAVRPLDEREVWQEVVTLKGDSLRGMTVDPVEKTYWAFSEGSLFELTVKDEGRDMWKVFLDRGEHERALQLTKTLAQRELVLAAQADAAFNQGRLMQAAQLYAQSSARFEEVTLKFIDAQARDPLRCYLVLRLERLPKTAATQRMMLATWLVEFYLAKCNELDDLVASESVAHDVENLQVERTTVEDDLREFFETYKSNLDRKTVYELILSHGRTDMYLHFATVVGDYAKVVEHWVMEGDWLKALEVLVGQPNLDMYYRFAPALMRNVPKEAVDAWLRVPALDPVKLVPALLAHKRDPLAPNHAIRYLNAAIFEHECTAPTVHTLLLTLLAAGDEAGVLRFLAAAPTDIGGQPYFDLDYALRICGPQGRARVYAMMGRWEEAVDAALGAGDVELAKAHADQPADDAPLRKRLWLKIARYVVRDKRDIKTAMRFLENTDLLKIEDILPFFPDFVVIDDFKDEICTALEGYAAHIDRLRAAMDDATAGADAIKSDIDALSNRCVSVDAGDRCAKCSLALLTRQFYVFPCQHAFHADCLIALNKEYLPPATLRKIVTLQTELVKAAPPPPTTAAAQAQQQQQVVLNGSRPGTPGTPGQQQQKRERTLLSAAFALPAAAIAIPNGRTALGAVTAANSLGRNVLSAAGTGLRELIVPESLANAISVWGSRPAGAAGTGEKALVKTERVREELEALLAAACPLCESVVAGLDKPFVLPEEVDASWQI
ncbi:hypothetical protein EXIGLDRAFT_665057 [Exidia glandulosa HHB12029]|uniref:Uncharacterized protein n=1 Tax=Exidia glandulosa HHB12029 TaxID=1314781 RepID=A0A165PRD9_EXIGL|nr:hypothetical protein EXIGLDRAFT_665057 [Exidia glandulosa HHB12029]